MSIFQNESDFPPPSSDNEKIETKQVNYLDRKKIIQQLDIIEAMVLQSIINIHNLRREITEFE